MLSQIHIEVLNDLKVEHDMKVEPQLIHICSTKGKYLYWEPCIFDDLETGCCARFGVGSNWGGTMGRIYFNFFNVDFSQPAPLCGKTIVKAYAYGKGAAQHPLILDAHQSNGNNTYLIKISSLFKPDSVKILYDRQRNGEYRTRSEVLDELGILMDN